MYYIDATENSFFEDQIDALDWNLKVQGKRQWSIEEDIIDIANQRGWMLEAGNGVRSKDFRIWVCDKKHRVEMRIDRVKEMGNCIACSHRERWTIPRLKNAILNRPFICLADDSQIITNKTLIPCKCTEDQSHTVWYPSTANLIHYQSGCPECLGKGEKILRRLMNLWFSPYGATFRKGPIPGCINPQTGRFFQFDMLSGLMMLILEYDGHHHDGPVEYLKIGEKEFSKIKAYDEMKDVMPLEDGWTLIRIPSLDSNITLKKMSEYVLPIILERLRQLESRWHAVLEFRSMLSFSFLEKQLAHALANGPFLTLVSERACSPLLGMKRPGVDSCGPVLQ